MYMYAFKLIITNDFVKYDIGFILKMILVYFDFQASSIINDYYFTEYLHIFEEQFQLNMQMQ